jgi:hypothetical protein
MSYPILFGNMASAGQFVSLSPFTQANTVSMPHSIVGTGAGVGMQDQGSSTISESGFAAPSRTDSPIYHTHGGHSGANAYPMHWAVYLNEEKAVNRLSVKIHGNCWGYFELAGSNNSGSSTGFATNGTWTNLSFVSSTNSSNNQNMGGQNSGLSEVFELFFTYNNNTPYRAYRIKILDSSRPNQSLGSIYAGAACYNWRLDRV